MNIAVPQFHLNIQQQYGVPDRIVREKERRLITSLSRTQACAREREGKFPARIQLSTRAIGWRWSELLGWVEQQSRVVSVDGLKGA